ncbi:MAG: hypothetical protein JSS96_01015 [Bacteroidetes bacterium]|nr:hypothetical protein [Bacteroidota bacterium]
MKLPFSILFSICVLTLYSGTSYAQAANPDNNITLTVNQPLVFSYNFADELVHDKIINNALELKVRSAQYNTNIYATLSLIGGDISQFAQQISLRLRNKTSISAATGSANTDIYLANTPVLLFYQPRMIDNTPYYSFYYDVVMHPFTYQVRPGTYNFSILFTMTQP